MHVIEQCCRGKHADQSLNEDGMLVGDAFAVVTDGVTSKSERRPWSPSGGVVAKDLLLEAVAGLPADADMRGVQRAVDDRFRAAYRAHPQGPAFFERNPVERLQANAVVFSAARGEAWLFGDCQIMVNGVQMPTVKRVDELLGELRSFAAHALRLRAGEGEASPGGDSPAPDAAREMIMPFLRLQSQFANRRGKYGYFVFDGFTDPTYPVHTVPVNPGDEVVLASDGYPLLKPTLAESERELERLRREDPALIDEYPSTKGFAAGLGSFDDRTYLRFVA
ncbi:hypothetical protein [Bifidobacterium avesanii]|uniref:Protein phosphatase 2C domain-containing protein n=1 Tax=Bifidobacterium avesanii TaxID=1798157 RepID=A0A7K3TGV6_9BIFI|nr:hypothetical protein [Bifidobacterium avesanii]KAB8293538.1 hypothetical protein DSM100685_0606 [Bifidobacterium avesanii]NEG78325.1 hypothetical protein [Bifidobacterium avesanii]